MTNWTPCISRTNRKIVFGLSTSWSTSHWTRREYVRLLRRGSYFRPRMSRICFFRIPSPSALPSFSVDKRGSWRIESVGRTFPEFCSSPPPRVLSIYIFRSQSHSHSGYIHTHIAPFAEALIDIRVYSRTCFLLSALGIPTSPVGFLYRLLPSLTNVAVNVYPVQFLTTYLSSFAKPVSYFLYIGFVVRIHTCNVKIQFLPFPGFPFSKRILRWESRYCCGTRDIPSRTRCFSLKAPNPMFLRGNNANTKRCTR